jgi:hypothetical protein
LLHGKQGRADISARCIIASCGRRGTGPGYRTSFSRAWGLQRKLGRACPVNMRQVAPRRGMTRKALAARVKEKMRHGTALCPDLAHFAVCVRSGREPRRANSNTTRCGRGALPATATSRDAPRRTVRMCAPSKATTSGGRDLQLAHLLLLRTTSPWPGAIPIPSHIPFSIPIHDALLHSHPPCDHGHHVGRASAPA